MAGCGLVRTGYEQLNVLSYWWLDRYLDFDQMQAHTVKSDLKALHAWHRSTQLPAYADVLTQLQLMAKDSVSPAASCEVITQAKDQFETTMEQTVPLAATLALSLQPSNLQRLRKKFAAEDKKWRAKWLDVSAEKLAETRSEQWGDRSEFFYGRLTANQKQTIRDAIARSSLDPQISWMLRQRRQEDILATLDNIRQSQPARMQAEAEVRALMARSLDPDDPAVVQMRRDLLSEACVNAAALHELTTPRQRKHAQEKLAGLAQDFRQLAAR